jgi:hypothetical protein
MLDQIITMDETMVAYHTRQTQNKSKQWIEKANLAPLKGPKHELKEKNSYCSYLMFFSAKTALSAS